MKKSKVHSHQKHLLKKNIKYNGKKYDQSSEFLKMYYSGNNTKQLISNIKKYKIYKKHHNKDELYLADLLK